MASFDSVSDLVHQYPDHFDANAAKGMDGVIQLDISGDKGGQFFLTVSGEELQVDEGEYDDPTVTITTTDENWLDIHRGEANPMSLMMKGQLSVSGSMAMATKFQDLFDM